MKLFLKMCNFFWRLMAFFKRGHVISLILILFFLALITLTVMSGTSSISAQAQSFIPPSTVVFEDDFSNGFDKWELARGSWDYWRIINGKVEAYIVPSFTRSELVPKDEFWHPAWQHYQLELDFEPQIGVDRNLAWGFQDEKNWYEIHFVITIFELVRKIGDTFGIDIFGDYVLGEGVTHHAKIIFNHGHIQIFVDDQELISADDWSFNHPIGKIALKVTTGAARPTLIYFDNVKVTLINDGSDGQLNVARLTQTDKNWADIQYDHANNWSAEPTIERWGCALTSLVMLLNYYGLYQMPDGNWLTPATVNAWLQAAVDGYLGEGHLNWLAAMRLVRQISEQYSTPDHILPKLEYRWVKTANNQETAINELANGRPVILQKPGHFLIADGFPASRDDLSILDPYYDYQQFSQHQQQLLSLRTFTPSQTDLSYLLITHQPGIELVIKDAQGQLVEAEISTQDEIIPPQPVIEEEAIQPNQPLVQHYLPKPNTGHYFIEIKAEQHADQLISIYAYDQSANVSYLPQVLSVSQEPVTVELDYQKDAESQIITDAIDWVGFQQLLLEKFNQGLISKYYVYYQLNQIAVLAEKAKVASHLRYAGLIKQWLAKYQDQIETNTMEEFLQFFE